MAGHIVQHMAECKTHAVALLPDVKAYWIPLLQFATVKAIEVAWLRRRRMGAFCGPAQMVASGIGGTLAEGWQRTRWTSAVWVSNV